MNSVVTRTRLERLLDERAALSRVHEETLAVIESRPGERGRPDRHREETARRVPRARRRVSTPRSAS